jgi:hypothetical protein
MIETNPFITMLQEVLIPGIFFSAVVLVVYFVLRARTKERLALIEKGIDLSSIVPKKAPNTPLKTGLFLTGIGLGVFVGLILAQAFTLSKVETVMMTGALASAFGGFGLILFHLVQGKNENSAI